MTPSEKINKIKRLGIPLADRNNAHKVMRDLDLVVSVAHIGDVDPEASHSTIEIRKAIIEFNCKLFKLKNVTFTENHALIKGERAEYSIHLGSGLIHQKAGSAINVLPVHS